MNDKLSVLRLFTRVARTSSFTRAGRELGISQPSVSRQISELEADVGIALFVRSTRAVKLTQAGADYLLRVEAILESLEEADHAARGTMELRGQLRVALSASFAIREVIPRIHRLMEAHPALRIELLMSDEREDLIAEASTSRSASARCPIRAPPRACWGVRRACWLRRRPIWRAPAGRASPPSWPTTTSCSGRRVRAPWAAP